MAAKKPVKRKAKAKKNRSKARASKGGRRPEAKKKKARVAAKRRTAKAAKPKGAKKARPRAAAKAKKRAAKKVAAKKRAPKKAAAKKKRSLKKLAARKPSRKKLAPKKRAVKKKRAAKAKKRPVKKPAARRVAKPKGAKKKSPARARKPKAAAAPTKVAAAPSRKGKAKAEAAETIPESTEVTLEAKAGKARSDSKRPAHAGAKGRAQNGAPKAGKSSAKDRREVPRTPALLSLPLPIRPVVKRPSVEERSASIEIRLNAQSEDFRKRYIESFDMSWIYHDSALEGVVYTFEELRAALAGQPAPVADSTLQPTCDDIRRHKEAIDFVRDFATKKRLPVTLDIVKKIYLILRPEEGDVKTVKYRKDVPQHRLYFHEYAPPDKIAYKVRQIVDWLNDPETRKTRNGVRIAARAHYDMLRVFPFPTESGKVARLFMNLLLLRSGLPPSIIHSTERQRYYEALKGSATTVLQMVQESVENALSSVEKLLDEHETRTRAFVS